MRIDGLARSRGRTSRSELDGDGYASRMMRLTWWSETHSLAVISARVMAERVFAWLGRAGRLDKAWEQTIKISTAWTAHRPHSGVTRHLART